jgi:Carboxypeptidase regulatory-like domain
MKKKYTVLIVCLLFCIKAISQIEGDVRSKDDKRIAKAIIVAMDTAKNVIDSVISAENGFYKFKTLKPGIYLIEAKAAGFESRLYKNIIARENFLDPDAGRDLSSATRLQIVLSPIKRPNQ